MHTLKRKQEGCRFIRIEIIMFSDADGHFDPNLPASPAPGTAVETDGLDNGLQTTGVVRR